MTKSVKSAAASKTTVSVKRLEALCNTAEKVFARTNDTRNQTLDRLADGFRKVGVTPEMLKGNAKTSAPRRVIADFFTHLVEKGLLTRASANAYGSSFWIAFEKQVPFSPSLANKKSAENTAKKKNVGTGKKTDDSAKTKGSIVVKASRDNLQSLLLQTIKMARDLGLKDFALELAESGREIDLLPKDFK